MNIQEIIQEVLEYLRGMWRYRWWTVGVAWLISMLAWFYVYSMPDVYSASAKVYVDTQSLMGPTFEGLAISDDLEAQVQAVSRALLTRPNIEAVARETDLDLRATTPKQMELLITRLQERIVVEGNLVDGNREPNVFSISYEDHDRSKAREVVAALVDAFVENSLLGQGNDAEITARALDSEIQAHEERLRQAEAELAQFKKDHLGSMPDDRGDYYGRLQQGLIDVRQTEQQLALTRERRDELQKQIKGEESVFGTGPASVGCSQQARIAQLNGELASLRVGFTDKHPSIVSLREIIASLEVACGAEREAVLAAGGRPRLATGDQPAEANLVYQNMRIQLSNAEVELAGLEAQLATNRADVERLRTNVDKIAEVEANLAQLNRDYGVVQTRYQELLQRRELLRSKERLDPVTDALQFKTLEPPFAAIEPVGPNRPVLLIVAMLVAIGAGGALALGLNQLQPVFFTRRSLQQVAGLPVLGSVSLLLTPQQASARRRGVLMWGASMAILVVATGLVVIFASQGAELMRQLVGGVGA